jgi:hypothetical protein
LQAEKENRQRQTDRKTERQKDRKTERQKDRKTERKKERKNEEEQSAESMKGGNSGLQGKQIDQPGERNDWIESRNLRP